jgi:hypothetical protein
MAGNRDGTPLEPLAGMAAKIALAVLLGALGGLLAAASDQLGSARAALDGAKVVFIVQTAWQGVCHQR